jgi:hypothetical protein
MRRPEHKTHHLYIHSDLELGPSINNINPLLDSLEQPNLEQPNHK